MKERPILFSGSMVRALLDGRKTQTRRVVKPQPVGGDSIESCGYPQDGFIVGRLRDSENAWRNIRCPYGVPGDRLIVRESGWERPARTPKMLREGADTWAPYYYDADGLSEQDSANFKAWGFKRRPSIHMPRWASRIKLEVVSVRVERLQEISWEDVKAEGCKIPPSDCFSDVNTNSKLRAQFEKLWDSINGKRAPWASNPWTWVIEFRRAHQ